jgi:hypothetical protein
MGNGVVFGIGYALVEVRAVREVSSEFAEGRKT